MVVNIGGEAVDDILLGLCAGRVGTKQDAGLICQGYGSLSATRMFENKHTHNQSTRRNRVTAPADLEPP